MIKQQDKKTKNAKKRRKRKSDDKADFSKAITHWFTIQKTARSIPKYTAKTPGDMRWPAATGIGGQSDFSVGRGSAIFGIGTVKFGFIVS